MALLPVAAMATIGLLIAGVAVLLAVVLMVRRKAERQSRGAGGNDKAKHLGKREAVQFVYRAVWQLIPSVSNAWHRHGHDGDRTAGHGHRAAALRGRVHDQAGRREAAGHFGRTEE